VVAPEYNNECTFTLLTFPAPQLPFVWLTKLLAALVLFAVCAVSVVVGTT
jgi:hypothetical protein